MGKRERCNCHEPDVVLQANMAGEGTVEEPIPVDLTLVKKNTYDVHALCQTGIAELVTRTLEDNRKLIVKGALNKATLLISIQNGEETPVITTVTDDGEKFVLVLKLKKGDKITFGFTAGDDFSIVIKALIRKKCGCHKC